MRWRSFRVADVWLAIVRPRVLVALAALVALQLTGRFDLVDARVTRAVRSLDPTIGRAYAPTVIAVDDAAVARLGPPPWDAATWATIVAALDRQRLGDVVLADPWPRLLRSTDVDGAPERVRVIVPAITWDGRPSPRLPDAHPAWIEASDASLALTSTPGGLIGEVTPDPRAWLPCRDTGACPPGARVEIASADVPIVSLATVLDAAPGFVAPGPGGALLGVTASPFADVVRVGAEGSPVPWVVATARAVASVAAGALVRPATARLVVAWLLLVHVLSTLATWRVQPGRAVALVLLLGIALPVGVLRGLHVLLPLVGTLVAAALPPIARGIVVGQGAVQGMRRLSLLVIRAASRAGTLRRRIASPDALLEALADLTRVHAADAPFALLRIDATTRRVRFHGGYGLTGRDFAPDLTLRHADVAAALGAWSGVEAARVLHGGRPARLIPLAQNGEVVGLWVVALPQSGIGPDPRRLARLARWIGERLALPDVAGAFSATTDLVPDASNDEALDNLFLAADEERRRWLACVQRVGVPILVTDVGGNVASLNPAMQDALEAAELPRPRSIRELVWRIDGEDHLDRWMDRLFGEGVTIALPWPGGADVHLAVRPVAGEADAGTLDQPLLGYLGWLEPGAYQELVTRKSGDGDSTELYLPKFGLG